MISVENFHLVSHVNPSRGGVYTNLKGFYAYALGVEVTLNRDTKRDLFGLNYRIRLQLMRKII